MTKCFDVLAALPRTQIGPVAWWPSSTRVLLNDELQ
jgi:hypothetical protein